MAEQEQKVEPAETVYGGCKGFDPTYLKMVSADGHEFFIKREYAYASNTLKAMSAGPTHGDEPTTFKSIPSRALMKVCSYLVYKAHWTEKDYFAELLLGDDPALIVDVMMAAEFLDC